MEKETGKEKPRFTKAQLLRAKRFAGKRDLLTALLEETDTYTVREAEENINRFMKKGVK